MKSVFVFRFRKSIDELTREILLVFSSQTEISPEHVSDTIEKEINTNLMPDEILFAVPSTGFDEAKNTLLNDSVSKALYNRLNNKVSVRLVSYDRKGELKNSASIRGPLLSYQPSFQEISRPAITSIFKKNGGFVQSTRTYHFVIPSGRHTNRFMRLSNILMDSTEISFLAFSCLRYISSDIESVYIDTPALYSILLAVNQFRSSFGLRTLDLENFRSYGGFKHIQPTTKDTSLVVISASSRGRLASKIQSEFGLKTSNLVHLLYLGENKIEFPVVCDLSYDPICNPDGVDIHPRLFEADSCEFCRQGSFQVYLDGDQFDIKGPQPEPLVLKRSHAPRTLSETISRLSETKALSVRPASLNEPDYYVDSKGLFNADRLKERLDYVLKRSIPASATHIVQVDPDSKELASKILKHIKQAKGCAEIIRREDIDRLDEHSNPSIIVAAVAIESGRCLTDISRDLRSVVKMAPVLYLVGVEKSTGTPPRQTLERTLTECPNPIPHEYIAVESLILPASSTRNSWNEEQELFTDTDLYKLLEDCSKRRIDERLRLLRSASSQLLKENSLFQLTNTGEQLQLQPGFVFLPSSSEASKYTQADVFFTIASVLQQLRANAQSSRSVPAIQNALYHQTILNPANFTRFNDDIIQASLLRAATPAELNFQENPDESREVARIICRIVQAAHLPRGGAAPEFLLAMATRRLSLMPADRNAVIVQAKKGSCMVKALGDILEAVYCELD